MRLGDLGRELGALPDEVWEGADRSEVGGVCADSRQVSIGDLFVCMPSARTDTHALLPEVRAAGASAAVVRSREAMASARSLGLGAILVEGEVARFNWFVGLAARTILGDPSRSIRVVGVTGTNGKTTTAWMIKHALDALGHRCGYIGTLGFQGQGEREDLRNTTPFPAEIWTLLKRAWEDGCRAVAMEASSHALVERRLAGVRFDVGVFTNLTQDHLDYHGTMAEYEEAKKLLFTEYAAASDKPFVGVVPAGTVAAGWVMPARKLVYRSGDIDLKPQAVAVDQLRIEATYRDRTCPVSMKFGGMFNAENAGSALATLLGLGVELSEAARALATVPPVPGRFEPVSTGRGFGAIVDYAHTPDGLAQLLAAVRALDPRRIITVFGCGGDRDRTKRPLMAGVVSGASDLTIITSDNPRTEDPLQIFADIQGGVRPGSEVRTISDRREAVRCAIELADEGDVVVVAGKGHENYQIVGHDKQPMDDRELIRAALGRVPA